ncbi:MAG: response regulator [Myxococcota bacterium]
MSSNKPSILIVDDEVPIRSALARIVSRQGFTPVEAASAEEVLAILDRGEVPAAAICDFNMPGMTGLELAGEINARFSDLPVLLLSGGFRHPEIDEAISSGQLWAYVSKPWSLAWMRAAVSAMVEGGPPPEGWRS